MPTSPLILVERANWLSTGGKIVPLATMAKLASMEQSTEADTSRNPSGESQSNTSLTIVRVFWKLTGSRAASWSILKGPNDKAWKTRKRLSLAYTIRLTEYPLLTANSLIDVHIRRHSYILEGTRYVSANYGKSNFTMPVMLRSVSYESFRTSGALTQSL